jgi:hypothetical protein
MAIKIMPINTKNKNEIKYYNIFNTYVLTNKNPHFPMVFFHRTCNDCPFQNLVPQKCYVVMNELAQGDLKMWLRKKHTVASFLSLWAQIAIAGHGLETEGLVHHDLHWGNILHHTVPKHNVHKYLHYKINDHDIYVKVQKEHWVLWDFGKMKPAVYPYETSLLTDISRISHFGKWAKDRGFAVIDSKVQHINNSISDVISSQILTTYFDFLCYLRDQFESIDKTVLLIDPIKPPLASQLIKGMRRVGREV